MGHVEPGRPSGRSPQTLIAAAVALALLAPAATQAAPTWEKQFVLGLTMSKELGRGIRWTKRPPNSAVFALYPEAAFRDHVSGVSLLECTTTARGTLTDCTVIEEKPEGQGFAQASLAVLALYEFGPLDHLTPEMVGRRVKAPIIWGTKRNSTREVRP